MGATTDNRAARLRKAHRETREFLGRVAQMNPAHEVQTDYDASDLLCVFCNADLYRADIADDPVRLHAPECLWREIREWIARHR